MSTIVLKKIKKCIDDYSTKTCVMLYSFQLNFLRFLFDLEKSLLQIYYDKGYCTVLVEIFH